MTETSLEITSLVQDGRGIGRLRDKAHPDLANMAMFVRGALPGQLVQVKINKQRRNFAEAELVAVLRDNPEFIQPFCANFGLCGGCPLQRVPYRLQLEWKAELAKDALIRLAKFDSGFVNGIFSGPRPSVNLQACRNKMEFAFGCDASGRLIIGQRRQGSMEVVPVESCPLMPPGHREILAEMASLARATGLMPWQPPARRSPGRSGSGFWRHLVLRHGDLGDKNNWFVLCITSPGNKEERKLARDLAENLFSQSLGIAGFVHEERRENDLWRHGGKRIFSLGKSTLTQTICGRKFELDITSFSQVNPDGANELAKLACETTAGNPDGNLLDLYCGIGAPGQLLADSFTSILGVDSQKASIAHAARNGAALPNCSYKLAEAGKFLNNCRPNSWHTILVDPPRSGLGEKTVDNIVRARPEQIIYISCNPVTFARDAALLNSRYELRRLGSVDLFPHTPHLECCSRWTLRHAN